MAANLRKQEFPASASQALQFIHSQVEHTYRKVSWRMLQLTFFFCSVTSSHKVEFHLQTSCLPSLNSSMSLFSSNDLLCQRYVSTFCKHSTSAEVGEGEREEEVEEDFPVCSNFSWYRSHLHKLDSVLWSMISGSLRIFQFWCWLQSPLLGFHDYIHGPRQRHWIQGGLYSWREMSLSQLFRFQFWLACFH